MKEKEIVIYARISHPEGLAQAKEHEHQLQYEAKFANGAFNRVRVTTAHSGEKTIEYTTKVKQLGVEGVNTYDERTCKVTDEFVEVFKVGADHVLDKTRFIFTSLNVKLSMEKDGQIVEVELPGILYEVDVFKKLDGNNSEWCKIDVEVNSIEEYITQKYPELGDYKLKLKISHLPFHPTEAIFFPTATDVQKQFVDGLWQNEYRIPQN